MARRPTSRTDGVGYGHPPPEGQFKKGASGNYRGRPPKPRSNRLPDPLDDDAFGREARRLLKHQDGDRVVESKAMDLVARRVFQDAMMGKAGASKLILDEIRRRAERQRRTRDDILSNAFAMKQSWADTKREQVRRGGKVSALEPPVPHPDELLITSYGDVHSVELGLQAAYRQMVEERDHAYPALRAVQAKLVRLDAGPRREELAQEAHRLARRIKDLERLIPDWWDDVMFELFGEAPPRPEAPPRRRSAGSD